MLVLVSGPPGAGKTTLARALAPRLGLPLVCKDDIKESLADSLGVADVDWSRKIGAATLDVLFVLMERFVADGASAVFESNFYPEIHRGRLLELRARHPFVPFELHCTADDGVLARRMAQRERHAVHHRLVPTMRNEALELDKRVLRLDTTAAEPFDLDHIVDLIGRT